MIPSWADQLSPALSAKWFLWSPPTPMECLLKICPVEAVSPPAAVTSTQPLLHVSPASRDTVHGEPASRGSTSGPYLLSSHLRPGIPASRGPASGVVSHCPAGRPGVLLPAPLRHVCLRSAGLKQFALDWCPSGHSRLLSRRILSRGVRSLPILSICVRRAPLALFRAGHSRLTSGRSSRLVAGPFLLAGSRPGAPAEELRYIRTWHGEHTSNARDGV